MKRENDKDALFQALLDGKLDVIATDHAPHTLEEKSNNYFNAPSGGPLVQHALTAMLEFVHQSEISLEKVVEKTVTKTVTADAPAASSDAWKDWDGWKQFKGDTLRVATIPSAWHGPDNPGSWGYRANREFTELTGIALLMEHIGLKAREEVEKNKQQAMDPNAPPELMQQAQGEAEKQIAQRIAKYTGEIIGQLNEAMIKMGKDPLIELKDKELGIKSLDVQRKTQSDQSKQQIEQAKLGAKEKADEAKIASHEDIAKLRAQVQFDKMGSDNRKSAAK